MTLCPAKFIISIILVGLLEVTIGGDSYSSYPRIPYDKAWVNTFTEGVKYYHPIFIDHKLHTLYVGSMNTIYRLDLQNISKKEIMVSYKTILPLEADIEICLSKFGVEHQAYDCQNHFRVIERHRDGRIYACTTGSHAPKDYLFTENLERYSPYPPEGIGVGKCPFDPRSSHAYVWSDKNNPANAQTIYSGTYRDIDKLDAFIYRPPIYDESGHKNLSFTRTVSQSLKVLNGKDTIVLFEPQFIKAFETEDCVYFFFNEVAIEMTQCNDEIIVPRVSRICKYDRGGQSVSTNYWATYVKARLNCSHTIHNEDSLSERSYFNELKDVFKSEDESLQEYRFYGLFASSRGGIKTSAICSFNLFDVDNALRSNFLRRSHAYSPWVSVPTTEVPVIIGKNRKCSNETDTHSWSDDAIYFMNEHPLVQNTVPQELEKPVFVRTGLNLKKIVEDKVIVSDQDEPYSVIFAISDNGLLYKIVYWYDGGGTFESNLVSSYQIFQNSVVNGFSILPGSHLYVTTNHEIIQVEVGQCGRYQLCAHCMRDPYCGWDKYVGTCSKWNKMKSDKLIQSIRAQSDSLCYTDEKMAALQVVNLISVPGSSVHIKCHIPNYLSPGPHPSPGKNFEAIWYHNEVRLPLDGENKVGTQDGGVVLLGLNASNSGSYKCMIRQQIIAKYELRIDTESCSLPESKERYNEKYREWCKEFESYKKEFSTWQARKRDCQNNLANTT